MELTTDAVPILMLKSISNLFNDFKQMPYYKGKRKKDYKPGVKTDVFDFISLINNWHKIVGENLAKHTIPLKNSYGTLTILTDHSAFSQQLGFMEEVIKKKVITEFPVLRSSIKHIKFQTNIGHFNAKKKQCSPNKVVEKKVATKLHPYSPQYKKLKEIADHELKDITDNELKESLTSIFIQMHSS